MAYKKITVMIDDMEISASMRRAKKKEVKQIISILAEKGDSVVILLDKMTGSEPDYSAVTGIIIENIDFICENLLLPFISLTAEQLDEVDMLDIVKMFEELLIYNGIDIHKLIKNFTMPGGAAGITENQAPAFG